MFGPGRDRTSGPRDSDEHWEALQQRAADLVQAGDLAGAHACCRDLEAGVRDRPWPHVRALVAWAGVAALGGDPATALQRYRCALAELGPLRAGAQGAEAEKYAAAHARIAAEAAKVANALGEHDLARDLLAGIDAPGPGADAATTAGFPAADAARAEETVRASLGVVTDPDVRAELELSLAHLCASTGRAAEARRLLRSSRDHWAGSATPQPWLARTDLAEAGIALDADDPEAARLVASAAGHLDGSGLVREVTTLRLLQARLAAQSGSPQRAAELLAATLDGPHPWEFSTSLACELVVALLGTGDVEEAVRRQAQLRAGLGAAAPDDLAFVELVQLRTDRAILNAGLVPAHSAADFASEHLTRAVITALALDALRFGLGSGQARTAWAAWAQEAWEYAFAAAAGTGHGPLVLELVDLRATSGSLSPERSPGPARRGAGRVTSPVDSGVALGLPAQVEADGRRSLGEYVDLAEQYFSMPVRSRRTVARTPPADRPVLHLRIVDAGDTYYAWTWSGASAGPGAAVCPATIRDEATALLEAALPDPLGEETTVAALRRALGGPLASPAGEAELMARLAERVLPADLVTALAGTAGGVRPLLRVQPSESLASVPWPLLRLTDGTRLVELADVETAAPLGVRPATVERRAWTGRAPVVTVVDPRVPGFRATEELGSVLGRPDAGSAVTAALGALGGRARPTDPMAAQRGDATRDWLAERLHESPDALVYVGHVTSTGLAHGQSEDTALHLADPAEVAGYAPAVRSHRPLSATDLLLGDSALRPDGVVGARRWPAPPRVVLLGCRSGGEARCPDAFGLAVAFLHNGAERVLATRWTLLTDAAVASLAGLDHRPLDRLAAAAIAAVDAEDPAATWCAGQRERLADWLALGRLEDSPLWWAAPAWVSA